MVLLPPYKYSEPPCDLKKVGLDTRPFTSSHTRELLRYRRLGPLLDSPETVKAQFDGFGLI